MTKKAKVRRIKSTTERPESYPEYLRRVGGDYAESGMEATAEDYHESAQLIEDLAEALAEAQKDWSEGRSLNVWVGEPDDDQHGKFREVDVDALLKRVTR